ncbi:MAG TPA: hypothetical protein VF137_12210 [Candidatus Dormibacteraeota bacterium]
MRTFNVEVQLRRLAHVARRQGAWLGSDPEPEARRFTKKLLSERMRDVRNAWSSVLRPAGAHGELPDEARRHMAARLAALDALAARAELPGAPHTVLLAELEESAFALIAFLRRLEESPAAAVQELEEGLGRTA